MMCGMLEKIKGFSSEFFMALESHQDSVDLEFWAAVR